MRFLRRLHLHPFLIGIFPVLSLYAHNQSQLQPGAAWRSLAVILAGTGLVFVLLRWITGDWTRAGFITTYSSFLFFIYGPVKDITTQQKLHFGIINLESNRYLLSLWLIVLIVGIWLLVRKVPRSETSLMTFNLMALATLILPLISITSYSLSNPSISTAKQPKVPVSQAASAQPDIYYIILDMYGRSDTIQSGFGYDNSAFLDTLRSQGFYVAACSSSNYTLTQLSMASALNMNYLPALGNQFTAGHSYDSKAASLIRDNAVRHYLAQYGYAFVSFETRYPFLNITDADVLISMPNKNKYIQPFEIVLLEQTPAILAVNEIGKLAGIYNFGDVRKFGSIYDSILFDLNSLSNLPSSIQSPKFVYAHLTIPHPVFVFGPNGEYTGNDERLTGGVNEEPVDSTAYALGYTNQVKYIDGRISQIAEEIIAHSKNPPVIIIQGDHGFGGWGNAATRLPILNAYYLPGTQSNQLLYPGITPVNTFRVVLDTYFHGQFGLLPDLNYLSSTDDNSYDAVLNKNQPVGCQPK